MALASAGILTLATLSGCMDNKPVPGGELVPQTAAIYITEGNNPPAMLKSFDLQSVSMDNPEALTAEKQFYIGIGKPEEKDLDITLSVDPAAAKRYAEAAKQTYRELPKEMVDLGAATVTIKAGSVLSDPIKVKFNATDALEANVPYTFAISLDESNSSKGITPLNINKTIVFTITRIESTLEITKTVQVKRDTYFALAQSFGNQGGNITLEGFVFIEKFEPTEANISTFMGIEGGTLLRFGDAGVNPNKLQVSGQEIPFPFETGRWYHIAAVYEGFKTKVYINGELKSEFSKSGSLTGGNPFFIGRSWSDERGIQARFAELRVWNVARSQSDITDNMLMVDPKTPGLLAYWKMNQAGGNTVPDATGHGYDLKQYRQKTGSGAASVTIFNEEDPISVEQ